MQIQKLHALKIQVRIKKTKEKEIKFGKLGANGSIHLACATDMVLNDSYTIK